MSLAPHGCCRLRSHRRCRGRSHTSARPVGRGRCIPRVPGCPWSVSLVCGGLGGLGGLCRHPRLVCVPCCHGIHSSRAICEVLLETLGALGGEVGHRVGPCVARHQIDRLAPYLCQGSFLSVAPHEYLAYVKATR